MDRDIQQLSERDHILTRPGMYIGSTSTEAIESYFYNSESETIEFRQLNLSIGLLKIVNEILDNSVDELVLRGERKKSISILVDEQHIEIQDSGQGIASNKINDEWAPVVAFCRARSGSNFSDNNRQTIGMNGVGAFASNVFSKYFYVKTTNKNKTLEITCENSLSKLETNYYEKNEKSGTHVKMYPDFSLFEPESFDREHREALFTRVLFLALSFPDIKFTWNEQVVDATNSEWFGRPLYIWNQSKDISIRFYSNPNDDPWFFSTVNGLIQDTNAGSLAEYVNDKICKRIHHKLSRKYDSLKLSEVRAKIKILATFNRFPNANFSSQQKTSLVNPRKEVEAYMNAPEQKLQFIANQILKIEEIVEPIIQLYRAKILANIQRIPKQKAVSKLPEKYIRPTNNNKYLVIVEGDSAKGGLMRILGRKDFGFYPLGGKPLNVITAKPMKISNNKTIKDLIQILAVDKYEKILIASDQDVDGMHIRLLLMGFFARFQSEYLKSRRICILNTPIIVQFSKNGKPEKWTYTMSNSNEFVKNTKYYKGLASFQGPEIKHIIEQEGGIENVIDTIEYDESTIASISKWLNNDSEPRKVELRDVVFSINKC